MLVRLIALATFFTLLLSVATPVSGAPRTNFAILLEGVPSGRSSDVACRSRYGEVIPSTATGRKHVGNVKWGECTVAIGSTFDSDFYLWAINTFDAQQSYLSTYNWAEASAACLSGPRRPPRESGSGLATGRRMMIVDDGPGASGQNAVEFKNAVVTEVRFPPLGTAASSDGGFIYITIRNIDYALPTASRVPATLTRLLTSLKPVRPWNTKAAKVEAQDFNTTRNNKHRLAIVPFTNPGDVLGDVAVSAFSVKQEYTETSNDPTGRPIDSIPLASSVGGSDVTISTDNAKTQQTIKKALAESERSIKGGGIGKVDAQVGQSNLVVAKQQSVGSTAIELSGDDGRVLQVVVNVSPISVEGGNIVFSDSSNLSFDDDTLVVNYQVVGLAADVVDRKR